MDICLIIFEYPLSGLGHISKIRCANGIDQLFSINNTLKSYKIGAKTGSGFNLKSVLSR